MEDVQRIAEVIAADPTIDDLQAWATVVQAMATDDPLTEVLALVVEAVREGGRPGETLVAVSDALNGYGYRITFGDYSPEVRMWEQFIGYCIEVNGDDYELSAVTRSAIEVIEWDDDEGAAVEGAEVQTIKFDAITKAHIH